MVFHVLVVLAVVAVLAAAITVLAVLVVLIVIIAQAVIVVLDVLIAAEIVITNVIQIINYYFCILLHYFFASDANIYKLFVNCLNSIVNCKFGNLYIYCSYHNHNNLHK